MWQYGSSLNTATSRPRTMSAMRLQVVLRRHAAGGVVRRVEERSRAATGRPRGSARCRPRRAESHSLAARRQHGACAAALDVRQIRREVGAEDQHAVAGIQEGLAEELLEHLRAGAGDDVARLGGNVELFADELRGRSSELGDAGRRAIVRLWLFLIASMPPARAAAVLSNGLSPISSSTTSLPAAFSDLAMASTVKAVSTDSERAKLLSCADTMHLFALPAAAQFMSSPTARHNALGQKGRMP